MLGHNLYTYAVWLPYVKSPFKYFAGKMGTYLPL